MSLANILGASDAIASPITALGNVFDQLFTSDEEKAQAQAVLEKLRQEPYILQAEINKLEAQHRSVFVAGWRPWIGWVCGAAFAWHFLLYDFANWYAAAYHPEFTPPVLGGTDQMITVLLAMLGIGGLRTVEKAKGLTR